MKYLLAAFMVLASCGVAAAQGCGSTNPNCIVPTAPAGTSDNRAASTAFVQSSASGSAVKGPATSVVGDVPQWNNTAGTLLSDPTAITANAQDFFFGTGRPWCDVRAKGAKGDGVTDDSAAFAACVTQLSASQAGGILYVSTAPAGIYCLFSGLSIATSFSIQILGSSYGDQTALSTCGHDVTLVALNNANHSIRNIGLLGSDTINTTHDTLLLDTSCTECLVDHVTFRFGRYPLNVAATDARISNIDARQAMGGAVIYTTASFSCSACKLDTSYPVSNPTYGTSFSAWAANNSYSTPGTVVSTAGSQAGQTYLIQLKTAGTSGSSAPTLQPFNSNTTDGTAVWQIVGLATNAAVQADTGSSTVTISNRSDLSGAYTYGLYLTGNSQTVLMTNSFIGGVASAGVYQNSSAGGVTLVGNQIVNCVNTGCQAVYLHTPGDAQVIGNQIFGVGIGVETDAASNVTISSNFVFGSHVAGVYIGGTVSTISVTGNQLGTSAAWGTNAIGVDIVGSGTDYLTVSGNQCHGATTCVSNSSTGTHNLIETTPGIFNTSISGCVYFNNGTALTCAAGLTADSSGNLVSAATITTSTLALKGSSTGTTQLQTNNSGASTFTATVQAATDTVVDLNTVDTLTNKTLTAPAINTATISGGTVNNAAIGGVTPAAGSFTTLGASSTATLTGQTVHNVASTIASATAATLDDVKVSAATTTITGNTGSPITALDKVHILQPTLTDSSSVTVTTAATLAIDNAPAQAGSVTITNAYALDVVAGSSLFGGKVFMSGLTAGSGTKALCLNATANEVQTDTSATICGISALRYKNLISEITPEQGLGVLSLRGETYRYKPEAAQDDKIHVSLIADDMAALNPACANYSPHGVENYMDRCFEAYQVAYDKKLWQIIGELRNEIADLRRGR